MSSFTEILKRIQEIHDKKAHDYSQEGDRYSNFKRAAIIAEWFNDPVDKVFATMIGIKLARKAELLNGKSPKNESVEDTFLDENTYSVIWHTWYLHVHEFSEKK